MPKQNHKIASDLTKRNKGKRRIHRGDAIELVSDLADKVAEEWATGDDSPTLVWFNKLVDKKIAKLEKKKK